ncbi:MAG: hypothetical protein KBG29_07735, partial [Pseudomonadales bacterium]|nr:hypothetical protein [Pseudomonadales bacterium]
MFPRADVSSLASTISGAHLFGEPEPAAQALPVPAASLATPFQYSRGRDKYDNRPEHYTADSFKQFATLILEDRSDAKGKQYICAPLDRNGLRSESGGWRLAVNAQPRAWMPLDLDRIAGPDAYAALLAHLCAYRGFSYTTASHAHDAPRCRIVLALSRPVDRAEGMRLGEAIQRSIERSLGAGGFTFDASVYRAEQPCYTPLEKSEVAHFSGVPIDVDEFLATYTSVDREAGEATSMRAHDRQKVNQWTDAMITGEDVHGAALRLVGHMVSAGADDHSILDWFEAHRARIEAARGASRASELFGGELERMIRGARDKGYAARAEREGWDVESFDGDLGFALTHDGLALELARSGWDTTARYVPQWGKWVLWNGSRWQVDERLEHMTQIREFLRDVAADLGRWADLKDATLGDPKAADRARSWAARQAAAIRQAPFRNCVETTARSNRGLVATPDEFDANPDMLGIPGGVVDLRTGEVLAECRELYITKCTAVGPAPKGTRAPLWESFLMKIFDGDRELIAFLQRAAGYALTGHTREHKLLFFHGVGRNGKSVFLNTLFGLFGDYGRRAPAATFIDSRGQHPTDLAGLHGARMVVASELPQGRAWNESVLKDLTGGDVITARLMRQDFFDFAPQFTLFLVGNHLPSFHSVDEAMRRRVVLVPFRVSIPQEEQDERLPEKLREEWPAILRWCLEGAAEWHRMGLAPPASVEAASAEYLDSEDSIGRFLAE